MVAWFSGLLLAIAIISLAYFSDFGRKLARFVYLTTKIPGPSLWEFATVYSTKLLSDDLLHCLCSLCAKYGFKPWGLWMKGGVFAIIISDSDSFSQVYKTETMSNKSRFFYDTAADYLGKGLISLNGQDHRRHRKNLSPVLRKSALDSHLPRINQKAEKLVQILRDLANTDNVDVRSVIEHQICATTISIISSDTLTYSRTKHFYQLLKLVTFLTQQRSMNPFWFLMKQRKDIRDTETKVSSILEEAHEILREERTLVAARLENTGEQPSNLLECLVQRNNGTGFSEEEYIDEMKTIFGAASETTAFANNVCLLLLALHPNVQERAFQELQSIFGGSERWVEPDDLPKMVFLENVIKESFRMFPPVPLTGRQVEEEVNINGVTCPKGSVVILNLFALHRNPDSFENPLKFDPDRFSLENSAGRHPFAYVPFSVGRRDCPGQVQAFMVLKTLLCHILRNFKVVPGNGLDCIEDIKIKMHFTSVLSNSSLSFVRR